MRIGNMAVGDVLRLNVKGTSTAFRVMHHGKPSELYDDSFAAGTVVMLDWPEAMVSRNMFGTTTTSKKPYSSTTMHTWLNETWLGYLDDDIRQQVVEVRVPYRSEVGKAPYEVAGGSDGLIAKVWLPAAVEVARGSAFLEDTTAFYVEDGAVFDYWKDAPAAQYADWAYIDSSGVDKGWATRTPNQNYTGANMTHFNQIGQDGLCIAGTMAKVMARPCLVLPNELMVVGGSAAAAANFPLKTDGVWRDGAASVKCGGIWHPAALSAAKVDGVWKE